jgi:hypothetical protein
VKIKKLLDRAAKALEPKRTEYAMCESFATHDHLCPLCRTLVKANTPHRCGFVRE